MSFGRRPGIVPAVLAVLLAIVIIAVNSLAVSSFAENPYDFQEVVQKVGTKEAVVIEGDEGFLDSPIIVLSAFAVLDALMPILQT